MAKYETMLITSAALDEEASAALVGKFKSLIEANGTIDSIDEWGKRRLAYPINDEEEGVYTVINFTSEPSFPADIRASSFVNFTAKIFSLACSGIMLYICMLLYNPCFSISFALKSG